MGQPERRFRIRLAGFLGKFPHEIDEMPSSEFLECMIYEQIEPFGAMGEHFHAGTVASTLINLTLKPGSEPITADKFIRKWDEKPEDRPPSPEEFMQWWGTIMVAQNSSIPKA
jgi:hypothetical protein